MPRTLLLLASLLAAGCAGVQPASPPVSFPPAPIWKTLLGDFVVPPLVAANHRIFVATRDGELRALDEKTGALLWKADQLPGSLTAGDGALLVRSPQGRVSSLQPRSGAVRWSVETGITGSLPAVIDGNRVLVAGAGLCGLELASGRTLFSERTGAEVTAAPLPLPFSSLLLTAEADGALRCRDLDTGIPIWSLQTSGPLLAPPLLDRLQGVVYLGTTEKRILRVRISDGHVGWRWPVGADIAHPGLLLRDRPHAGRSTRDEVLFASFDAVLYALHQNGNLAWRAPLPSRPLSGPLLAGKYLVIACLEDRVEVIAPESGERVGSLRTSAEIRTPPLVLNALLAIGLRDRSVVAYPLPGAVPTRPKQAPAAPIPEPTPTGPGPSPVVPPAGDPLD